MDRPLNVMPQNWQVLVRIVGFRWFVQRKYISHRNGPTSTRIFLSEMELCKRGAAHESAGGGSGLKMLAGEEGCLGLGGEAFQGVHLRTTREGTVEIVDRDAQHV